VSRGWYLVELHTGQFWLVFCVPAMSMLGGESLEVLEIGLPLRAEINPHLDTIANWWFLCEEGETLPSELPVQPDVIEISLENAPEVQ